MTILRRFTSIFFVAAWAVALAGPNGPNSAPNPVVIQHSDHQRGESTLNLQSSQGASCATPVIGNCGSCSVSCTTGQSAQCKPGIAVGPQASASCVTAPECNCK